MNNQIWTCFLPFLPLGTLQKKILTNNDGITKLQQKKSYNNFKANHCCMNGTVIYVKQKLTPHSSLFS